MLSTTFQASTKTYNKLCYWHFYRFFCWQLKGYSCCCVCCRTLPPQSWLCCRWLTYWQWLLLVVWAENTFFMVNLEIDYISPGSILLHFTCISKLAYNNTICQQTLVKIILITDFCWHTHFIVFLQRFFIILCLKFVLQIVTCPHFSRVCKKVTEWRFALRF